MVESGSLERVALDIQRLSLLKDLRTKFAIAKPGANFHLRPDCRDCADDFAALVRSDRCKRDRYEQRRFDRRRRRRPPYDLLRDLDRWQR